MSKTISVLLIDDHTVARSGLRLMLSGAADITVDGEADSAAAALRLLSGCTFTVALLDVILPDRHGLDLLRLLREQHPGMAVLIVSANPEEVYAVRALKGGAAGYLTKDCLPDDLVTAVRKAAGGGKYVTPSLLQRLADMLGDDKAAASHETLTDRELVIFRMIASGSSLVSIAAELHLSPSTVTTYRARILEKMGMKNNAELTRYGLDHGMLG